MTQIQNVKQKLLSMKNISFVLFALTLSHSSFAKIVPKVIYGRDNRQDAYEVINPLFQEMINSSASLMDSKLLSLVGDEYIVKGRRYGVANNLCKDERFYNQTTAGDCSGFLIGERTLVTAGHCVRNEFMCKNTKFVFGYKAETEDQEEWSIPQEDVYNCEKLVTTVLNQFSDKADYAVIELDRDVVGRRPLPFRTRGRVGNEEELAVVGNPSGLPTKIADGAYARSNDNPVFFVANLDSYGGSSGSAVFNVATGEVEGILVRGATDFVMNGTCMRSNHCSMDGCRGEDVTRITIVREIQ